MSLANPLRDAILDKLHSGQWRAGDRLPTERELSEQHGVSRTTVRKALLELKQQGLIEQTVGSGTYVAEHAGLRLGQRVVQDSSQTTSPAELMEARLALEPAIIEMAIRNANAADLRRMEQCCAEAEQAQTLEAFEHWDAELHQAIADAAHNSFVANVFQLMKTVRAQGDWGQLKKKSVTPERRLAYQAEHRAIVDALRERDAARAREHTLAHLLHVRQNLLGV
ncbi:MAG: FadR family transcriptional regulator [Hydrogenophaga sp.]|uniref:FadR family transcriptional regulator n=1 Tax=Hydrogenophaga crocea TaxID=2716225 RepID=A0A6G8IH52_9BURK|nr:MULTISPECIES: FadR/GntR family transcriptional regulator [Hydrogenophaga]MBL0944651.1 FadR family transcriptional regulator [Hydrogenophaga sp.]QIM52473.1 FadR family transcriptional regulator [Hydrogenophaga crocea]